MRRGIFFGLLAASILAPASAIEVDGFTEPYRTVDVAAPEMGLITSITFRVGDVIQKGEIVATLDDDLHKLLVESGKAKKDARGTLESARAELQLREHRLAKLKAVFALGHGRKEEVSRAQADMEIAAANVLVAKDDILLRTLEYRRLSLELARRKIRSPISGVVAEIKKEVGEFVSPHDPQILTIVQLDTLLAKFSLRRSQAEHLQLGDELSILFPHLPSPVRGEIDEIAPVIDAESGTIRVKVRFDNSKRVCRSGQRCFLDLPDPLPSEALTAESNSDRPHGRDTFHTKPVVDLQNSKRKPR